MILVRTVFQAKYGRGDELVAAIKEATQFMSPAMVKSQRLLTDLSGRFFTVVMEYEATSVDQFQKDLQAEFAHPKFAEWFGRTMDLVESGSREFYTIVD